MASKIFPEWSNWASDLPADLQEENRVNGNNSSGGLTLCSSPFRQVTLWVFATKDGRFFEMLWDQPTQKRSWREIPEHIFIKNQSRYQQNRGSGCSPTDGL